MCEHLVHTAFPSLKCSSTMAAQQFDKKAILEKLLLLLLNSEFRNSEFGIPNSEFQFRIRGYFEARTSRPSRLIKKKD